VHEWGLVCERVKIDAWASWSLYSHRFTVCWEVVTMGKLLVNCVWALCDRWSSLKTEGSLFGCQMTELYLGKIK